MRVKINLDTMSNIQKFVDVTSRIDDPVFLEDNTGFKVSAKSILGALATMDWNEVYCECAKDISGIILPWII